MTDAVIALGELLLRFSALGKSLIVQSHSVDVAVGGAEANVLAGLAALGRKTKMISQVADNSLGALAISALRARGIDTSSVKGSPGRMGLYFYESGQGRRASAIIYDRQDSVFARANWKDTDLSRVLGGASLFHLSGITPALGKSSADFAIQAVKEARQLGVPISFDCKFRAQLWQAWSGDPKFVLRELIGQSDVLFGNHRDIAMVTGGAFSGEGPERRRHAAEAAFDAFPNLKLIGSTARQVLDSDHHRISARVDKRDGHAETDPIDVRGIVDRIGTGDAFAAGVLHEMLNESDCDAMARFGLAMCILKHSIPGDMSYFTAADVAAFWSDVRDVRR